MATPRGFTVDPAHQVGRLVVGGTATITLPDGTTKTGIAGPVFVGVPAAPTSPDDVSLAAIARGIEGILEHDTGNGERAALRTAGRGSITVNAAVSEGDELTLEDGTGKAKAPVAGEEVFVRAREAAAADGDVIEVDVIRPLPFHVTT